MDYPADVDDRWSKLIELMEAAGVMFENGLTDVEVASVEEIYGFHFPLDLRNFLQTALPKHFPFANWRSGDDAYIREMLRLPLEGVLFDVEHDFWLTEWGPRPARIEDAKALVEDLVSQAPKLIPIYSHRMMPDRPHGPGNPVLSVHQTDIIYYGFDLDDYLRHEFNLPDRKPWPSEIRAVEFWDVDRWQDVRWR